MTLEVTLAETAWRDLDEIYDWVADGSDPVTARNYISRILLLCGSLSNFPLRGSPRDDLAPGAKTIAFERRASIAYRVSPSHVTILRVLHKGRDQERAI